jgi:hypothetical protein
MNVSQRHIAPIAREPISPYTFDYRGTQTVLKRSGSKWCYGVGGKRRCAPTFRQAVVEVKQQIDGAQVHENPDGAGVLIALIAAALGAGGTYFYMRYREKKGPITDQMQVAQAKLNLASATQNNTWGLPVYTLDKPPGTVTPAFTQALAQFQDALNKNMKPADVQTLRQTLGNSMPAFPLRTDGVLDQGTADWLVIAVSG